MILTCGFNTGTIFFREPEGVREEKWGNHPLQALTSEEESYKNRSSYYREYHRLTDIHTPTEGKPSFPGLSIQILPVTH